MPYVFNPFTSNLDWTNPAAPETDPVFTAWDKSTGISITESQISDFGTYLTEEEDPVFTAWDKSTGISITESQISDFGTYLTDITGESIFDLSDFPADPGADKFLKWNDTGGVLEWADVTSVSFGTTTQVPYMNAAGDDFLYSANNIFDGAAHISSNFQTKATSIGAEKISNGTFDGADTTGWTLNTGWFGGYIFTVSGITTAPGIGSTWTNNGVTYTHKYSSLTGTAPNKAGVLWMSGAGDPEASGTLTKASGTGDATIAFSANSSGVVFHGATGTGVFSQASGSMTSAPVVGEYYHIQFTTQYKFGSITPSFAGVTLPTVTGYNKTYTYTVKATTTDGISFTPSNTARMAIDDITIKKVDGNIYGSGQLLLEGVVGEGLDAPRYGSSGAKLLWHPKKGAFLVGSVDSDQWDENNIGLYAVNIGRNNKAKEEAVTTIGVSNSGYATYLTILGNSNWGMVGSDASIIIGQINTIYGGGSFIAGTQNTSYGLAPVILGDNNVIESSDNYSSIIGGSGNITYGNSSYAVQFGISNIVESGASYSVNFGASNQILSGAGYGTTNVGYGNINGGLSSISMGAKNVVGTVYAGFAGGYGSAATGDGAFIWTYNQNDDAGTTQSALASGAGSFVAGYPSTGTLRATGLASCVIGEDLEAQADNTYCFGKGYQEATASSFNVGWGQRDFQVKSGQTTFGGGVADQDYVMSFVGETNSGEFKWMEDEDYFEFSDKIAITSTTEQFRLSYDSTHYVSCTVNSAGNLTLAGGNVGIGSVSTASRFFVAAASPSAGTTYGGVSIQCPNSAVSSNAANYWTALTNNATSCNISTGVTDSGYRASFLNYGFINDANFVGTLTSQYGMLAYSGIYAGTGTVTNSYGLRLDSYAKTGTIINRYDLYIGATTTGGTITNNWCMYSLNTAPSLFYGDMRYRDNVKLVLGNDLDVEVYYDGTDLCINPRVVGSGVIDIKQAAGSAPSSTTPAAWLDVKINGTAYKMALYQ